MVRGLAVGRRSAVLPGALLLAAAGAGCVSAPKFQQLENRYVTQETELKGRDTELAQARERVAFLEAKVEETAREKDALKAELEKKEAEAAYQATVTSTAGGTGETGATGGSRAATTVPAAAGAGGAEVESLPAPPGGEWKINPATGGIVLDNAILFSSGQAVLKEEGKAVIDRLAASLGEEPYRDLFIRVDGHTDDLPIRKSGFKDNWDLSARRALAVLNHLETRGIDPKRLSFAGFGEHVPIAQGSMGAQNQDGARAQNRRVEIVLLRR